VLQLSTPLWGEAESTVRHIAKRTGLHFYLAALLAVFSNVGMCAQSQPAPATQPPEQTTTTAIAPSEDVRLLERFSEQTIQSEEHSIDTIKTVFEGGVTFVSAVLGIAAFLGYRELKSVAKNAKRNAVQAVHQELASLREVGIAAKEVATQTLRAIRYITIAETHKPPDAYSIRQALDSVLAVRQQAKKLSDLGFPDRALEAWTLSMEAYCYASLEDFVQAAEKQRAALHMTTHHHAVSYLNLACYLARAGKLEEAAQSLKSAIADGGEAIKQKAVTDPDLSTLRSDARYRQLFA
jgi:tetratricopeptide (TPR) repeat protein